LKNGVTNPRGGKEDPKKKQNLGGGEFEIPKKRNSGVEQEKKQREDWFLKTNCNGRGPVARGILRGGAPLLVLKGKPVKRGQKPA